MKTNYKRIPFDLNKAKFIMNGEMKGRIVTRDGRQARIICFDRKGTDDIFDPPKNIIALVENKDGSEGVFAFRNTLTLLAKNMASTRAAARLTENLGTLSNIIRI